MLNRKSPVIVALALAGGLFAGAAHAGGVNWSINIGVPAPVYAEPVYYPPPPVYYSPPPPVYYRPAPVVVYGPPAVVYRGGPPAIVGGSWERHRGHRHDRYEQRYERRGDGWRGGDRPGRGGDHYGRGGW